MYAALDEAIKSTAHNSKVICTGFFQGVRDAAPYLAHMQLGDSSRLESGTGHVDFAGPMDALAEAGYDGWYAMECGLSGDPAVVLPKVSAFLRG